ncbi:MAG: YCF48-related protein [Paludibacter sp.]
MKTKLLLIAITLLLSSPILLKAQTTQYAWDYVSTLQNEWLQKICTQGLDTVYIVGRNGLIAKSTDRVLTWNKQYPVTAQLNDIIFCNHTTGFAVGNNGTILRTTNAGTTWTPQVSGTTNNLNAIAATGLYNMWAVGDNGTVLSSTNAGLTWQLKDFSVSVKLNDVSFRNNEGYIVGDTHTCFVSEDYGTNWRFKDIHVDNPYNLPATVFDLFSIDQTENHICILYGRVLRGEFINIDNSTFVRPPYPFNSVTNFVMKNDSIGYGFWKDCLAGSSGCSVLVPVINILNSSKSYCYDLSYISHYLETDYIVHADMSFVNDSIEYVVAGPSMFHLKKYVPVIIIPDGINETENKKISIMANSIKLTIQFENETLDKIELYGITGLKILSENIHANETSKSLNITDLSKGTYIIHSIFSDKSESMTKWIKQ